MSLVLPFPSIIFVGGTTLQSVTLPPKLALNVVPRITRLESALRARNSRAPLMKVASTQRGTRLAPNVPSGANRRGIASRVATRGKSRASTRTYTMRGWDKVDTSDDITGTYLICGNLVFILIDRGSTLSYVCSSVLNYKN